mmetsp:Transcript_40996/g.108362  ORF Transcript_40996/g.108362 Transcript_40996/m.108362 type:complete len:81 (-) Transcript_40996:391-633(-)
MNEWPGVVKSPHPQHGLSRSCGSQALSSDEARAPFSSTLLAVFEAAELQFSRRAAHRIVTQSQMPMFSHHSALISPEGRR